MEPIEESTRAVNELDPDIDEVQLLDDLRSRSEEVTRLVPECIGLSVTVRDLGVTLTLVSTSKQVAVLDATQYVEGGPCVAAASRGDVLAFTIEELFNEESWRLFSQTAAAAGVASTLTLPVLVDGDVRGTINLYAASPHAFDGHHRQLADIFGAWAAGATTNADLSFTTLDAARGAPRILADRIAIETATGLVMACAGVSVDEAHRRLADAALRAGVSEAEAAQAVVVAGMDRESWPPGLGAETAEG